MKLQPATHCMLDLCARHTCPCVRHKDLYPGWTGRPLQTCTADGSYASTVNKDMHQCEQILRALVLLNSVMTSTWQ